MRCKHTDPTGSGNGGSSIYGHPFKDEFHSRLRFARRGMIAMAHDGASDSNQSQFFITLDKADHLNRVHTIFGKVVGETIFNVLKIGEVEVNGDERPLYPPRILTVDILSNPFGDIVPRDSQRKQQPLDKSVSGEVKSSAKAIK